MPLTELQARGHTGVQILAQEGHQESDHGGECFRSLRYHHRPFSTTGASLAG